MHVGYWLDFKCWVNSDLLIAWSLLMSKKRNKSSSELGIGGCCFLRNERRRRHRPTIEWYSWTYENISYCRRTNDFKWWKSFTFCKYFFNSSLEVNRSGRAGGAKRIQLNEFNAFVREIDWTYEVHCWILLEYDKLE